MPAQQVYMLRPEAFGFNPQTAASNTFQRGGGLGAAQVARLARKEWEQAVEQLQQAGVVVHELPGCKTENLPDEIFLNNWFSTHPGGRLVLYPLLTPNRQREVRPELIQQLQQFPGTRQIVDLREAHSEKEVLEGTGSLVLNTEGTMAYAVLSERTTTAGIARFTEATGIPVFAFLANRSIYHTNVLMCLTEKMAIVCLESIADEAVRKQLVSRFGEQLMTISVLQMEQFCGNMLGLHNADGESLLVMSATAQSAFSDDQWRRITAVHRPVVLPIPVIEQYGGGSARCLLAECYG